ncbi:PLP-dependent aminotransferase family protein [Pseudomonas sp. nanlin1]|uniref:aminotransferase-like domain-containing protein n=1 Tax=Pseudomonas sp. nanlin1 TaxID=3040605 RepID=UPI00388E6FEB
MRAPGQHASFAYQEVYRYLCALINDIEPGQVLKLPSLRDMARRLNVSMSTIQYAYALLEAEGQVYSVAKTGYYARAPLAKPFGGTLEDPLARLNACASWPGMCLMSQAEPCGLLSLAAPLHAVERDLLRQYPHILGVPGHPFGEPELRRVLAARYTRSLGDYWSAEDVFLGADIRGVLEGVIAALGLAGHTVVVESPCSWTLLRTLRDAGVKVLELALCRAGRVDLDRLQRVLSAGEVRLALFSSTVCTPRGSLMPAADKRAIAQLLDAHGVWLLENDLDGDLCFHDTLRFRDAVNPERLMVMGALEPLVGAEMPYGYLLSRHARAPLQREWLQRSFRLPPIRQRALARLFLKGAVDTHLVQLRASLQQRLAAMTEQAHVALGEMMACQMPLGGAALWLEAGYPVNLSAVFERLVRQRIVIAPGEVFSLQGLHRQSMRLGCWWGEGWSQEPVWEALADALWRERI